MRLKKKKKFDKCEKSTLPRRGAEREKNLEKEKQFLDEEDKIGTRSSHMVLVIYVPGKAES